jgi:hypothetical protein
MATVDEITTVKQNLDFLMLLTYKLQDENPLWCEEVRESRGNLYIQIIGKINLKETDPLWWDAEAFVWTIWCRIDDQEKAWYYGLRLKILQPRREIPQNKIDTATAITQTKFYTATSLLDAMEAFYVPLPSGLGSLTNIHERLKQLESLYQTRQAMMQ